MLCSQPPSSRRACKVCTVFVLTPEAHKTQKHNQHKNIHHCRSTSASRAASCAATSRTATPPAPRMLRALPHHPRVLPLLTPAACRLSPGARECSRAGRALHVRWRVCARPAAPAADGAVSLRACVCCARARAHVCCGGAAPCSCSWTCATMCSIACAPSRLPLRHAPLRTWLKTAKWRGLMSTLEWR